MAKAEIVMSGYISVIEGKVEVDERIWRHLPDGDRAAVERLIIVLQETYNSTPKGTPEMVISQKVAEILCDSRWSLSPDHDEVEDDAVKH